MMSSQLDKNGRVSIPAVEPDLPRWIWCLVANVRDYPVDVFFNVVETKRRGTKHFGPGTRVYVYPIQWGDGWERVMVIGRKRGTRRLIRKIMAGDMLDNYRLKKVYSPTVISWMCGKRFELIKNRANEPWGGDELPYGGWDDTEKSRREIEEMVDSWQRHKADPEGYMEEIRTAWEREFSPTSREKKARPRSEIAPVRPRRTR